MSHTIGIIAFALSPDPREAVRMAKRGGFAGVEFDVSLPGVGAGAGGMWLQELDRSGQRELVRVLAAVDVKLLSLGTSAGRSGFSVGADVDRALGHLDKSLKVAADLGRTSGAALPLCVDIGPLPPPPVVVAPPPKAVDTSLLGRLIMPEPSLPVGPVLPEVPPDVAFESQLDAAMRALGRMADRYSVRVALRSELGSLPSLHRAMSAAECPMFALELDPVAVLREPKWTMETCLREFAGRVGHVRARDGLRGSGGRTQSAAIGRGHTNWSELIRLLDDANFEGAIVVDPMEHRDRARAGAEALEYLRGVAGVS